MAETNESVPIPVQKFQFSVVAKPAQPRCVIEKVAVEPSRVEVGNPLTIKFALCNKGNAILKPRVGVVIKGPSTIPASNQDFPVVAVGRCNTETMRVFIPKTAQPGTYTGLITCYGGIAPVARRIEVKAI